jgi:hypothetical protein
MVPVILLYLLLAASLITTTEALLRPTTMALRRPSTTALGLTPIPPHHQPPGRMMSSSTDGSTRTVDVLFTAPLVMTDGAHGPTNFLSRVRQLCMRALVKFHPELAFRVISNRAVAAVKKVLGSRARASPTATIVPRISTAEGVVAMPAIKDQYVRGYVRIVSRAKESAKNVLRDYISFQKRGVRTFHLTRDEAVTRDMGLIGLALRSYVVRAAKRGDQNLQRSVVSAAMRALKL